MSVDDAARSVIASLRAMRDGGEPYRALLRDVLTALVTLHAWTDDGALPEEVDGAGFRDTVADLLDGVRAKARLAADYYAVEIEEVRPDDFFMGLVLRSGLQFLTDDFAGTAGDGIVDPDQLATVDDALTQKLQEWGVPRAAERPPHVPASHWWWWRTTPGAPAARSDLGGRLTLLWGEAYDDVSPAFSVVERDYPSPEAARAAFSEGADLVKRAGIITEHLVEKWDGLRPAWPTWEQFRRKHAVEGVPFPVRPPPRERRVPPGWAAMHAELERVRAAVRGELTEVLREAVPGADVETTSDRGVVRKSPGSVDFSEERYGVDVEVTAFDMPGSPTAVSDRVMRVLQVRGWRPEPPRAQADALVTNARRDLFTLSVIAREDAVSIWVDSPLYRAPAEPGSTYVLEPRPAPA